EVTQEGLPLVPEPYHQVADKLGVPVEEVKNRLQRWLDTGAVRRIAAVPNHYRMGYAANGMTVWDVPDEVAEELGEQVGALEFVSHCYLRPRHPGVWNYNLFAMVHGKTRDEALEKVEQIRQILGKNLRSHDVLFSRKILKKTGFRLSTGKD
ncbi:MAG: hypothetical protein KDD43_07110, partial [Bdellovibrionales bacterium]|nr:hypothetical protein [Bdellovibrionales bacterium]